MRRVVAPVVAALLLAGCASAPPAPSSPSSPASAWSVTDTEGATWSPETLAGEPALLFFMATWCGSCQATAPKLARLHEAYGDRVQFLSVGYDPSETPADLEGWKASKAQPWPHALDPLREAQREYGIAIQSVVVVLDADGTVAWKSGYGPNEDEARAALDGVVAV